MDMFADLLTSSSRSRVSAETLEMLGRKASHLFQDKGIPLNDAIRQVVADAPELGNEHIKRIVEFANTVTFQEMFQNSTDKNIHFQVADPGVVIRDLKDGGSPAHDGKTLSSDMSDYTKPPKMEKDDGMYDANLEDLFGHTSGSGMSPSEEVTKTASVHESLDQNCHANPIEDVYDTHIRLQAAREKCAEVHERFYGLVKEAREELRDLVRHEVIDPEGSGLAGVVRVFEKVASPQIAVSILRPIVEDIVSQERYIDLGESFEKTAGEVINPTHPMVLALTGLIKAAQEQVRAKAALDEVDAGLIQTSGFLKNAGALTTGIKNAVNHSGKVPNSIRQRFSRK